MAFGGFVGASLERMAINQGVIFAFAVFVWSMTAMGTFIYRHIFFVALAVMFFGTCTQLVVVAYAGLPGFAMLMTPVVGETIFSFRGGAPAYDAVYTMGIAGQAVLFGIFFLGSCRLYRGTYPTALSVFLGMLLLGVWAGLSATGIGLSDQLAMTRIIRQFRGDGLDTVQVVMSLASCMLLSAVPFWAALQEERAGKSNSWLMHVLLVTLAGVLVSVPAWGAGQLAAMSTRTMVVTLLCGGAQVLTIHCLLRMVRSMRLILALLITGMALSGVVARAAGARTGAGDLGAARWRGGGFHVRIGDAEPRGAARAALEQQPGVVRRRAGMAVVCGGGADICGGDRCDPRPKAGAGVSRVAIPGAGTCDAAAR